MDWPSNADGDVMRRLQAHDFDFSQSIDIDFNIDFEDDPPSEAFVVELRREWPDAIISATEGDVQLTLNHHVTYEFVILMQDTLTKLAEPYGGYCESWGLLQEP